MKLFTLIPLIFLSLFSIAQDVVVFVTAYAHGGPIPMNTIELENLTHPGTLSIDSLPQAITTYAINLSTGRLINSIQSGQSIHDVTLILNTPGKHVLQTYFPRPTTLHLSLISLSGKILLEKGVECQAGAGQISITTGTGSTFVLRVQSNEGQASFKLPGNILNQQTTRIGDWGVSGTLKQGYLPEEKTTTDGFVFTPGDQVRFTGIRHGWNPFGVTRYPQNGDSISMYITQGCPATMTDYDGNTYETVLIGEQCWMKENLKTTHYADGTPLIDVTGIGNWAGQGDIKYWFDYNDDAALGEEYGKLYSGGAVMNGASGEDGDQKTIQGVCPDGWHVPSNRDWQFLEEFLGLSRDLWEQPGWRGTDEGNKLKEADTIHWNSPYGNNSSGFTAFGSGLKYANGISDDLKILTSFWAASCYEGYDVFLMARVLASYQSNIGFDVFSEKDRAKSCRCIRD